MEDDATGVLDYIHSELDIMSSTESSLLNIICTRKNGALLPLLYGSVPDTYSIIYSLVITIRKGALLPCISIGTMPVTDSILFGLVATIRKGTFRPLLGSTS